MSKYYAAVVLFRLVLPLALIASLALRPFGVSILYLLLYLWLPLVQMPNTKTYREGIVAKVPLICAFGGILLLLCHVVWHIVLAALHPYASVLKNCMTLQYVMQNLGFVSFKNIDSLTAVCYLAPELLTISASLGVHYGMKNFLGKEISEHDMQKDYRHQQYPFLTNIGKYLSLFLVLFCGIAWPCVVSSVYFLVFVGAATAWACGRELGRGYALVLRLLMVLLLMHLLMLTLYQNGYAQSELPPEHPIARYFGLTQLLVLNCSTPQDYLFSKDLPSNGFLNPIVLLFTYFILGLITREIFKPKVSCPYMSSAVLRPRARGTAPETTPLVQAVNPDKSSRRSKSLSNIRGLHQDSTGSFILPDEDFVEDDLEEPTFMDDFLLAVIDFFEILIRSSYIATSIIMMAWSIMYHSWLGFVFLMWASIVWMNPNQRRFMMASSPFLVLYAILILLIDYIYAMQFTEDELPTRIGDIQLKQLGIERPKGLRFVPLLVKSLMTSMFWVTLRQRNQERRQRMQAKEVQPPVPLTVSTQTSDREQKTEEELRRSRIMSTLSVWLNVFCTKYWIYVVVVMLFIIGITGVRMTIFRIVYMFLFLAFILMFQISWNLWRRMLKPFWIAVICYSMINLMLVYVYQFENCNIFIENNLKIPTQLQEDLGLERFDTADLFMRLLTPTAFLIITIIQVHYFHAGFLEYCKFLDTGKSESTVTRSTGPPPNQSARPSQSGLSTIRDDLPALSDDDRKRKRVSLEPETDAHSATDVEVSSLNATSRSAARASERKMSENKSVSWQDAARCIYLATVNYYIVYRDIVILYLEIHMSKIIFISLMLLSVSDVCAMHVPIMAMLSLAFLLKLRRQKLILMFNSFLICVYLMVRMIYQINYIHVSNFQVNCTAAETKIRTGNNAEWLGLRKSKNLAKLCQGYIALIAMFTLHSIIIYRQKRHREQGILPPKTKGLMFPEITRLEADKDLNHCIKYLVNYGFYKFGVEVSLICLIGVVGSRMDLYAALYACLLLALVCVDRRGQARVWPAVTVAVACLLTLQYMIAVGFLPQFCVRYLWETDDYLRVRNWMFLPYEPDRPHASKLIFDFFFALFATLQWLVFGAEARARDSPGGSNDEHIAPDYETPHFRNPVPDFTINITSWLDIVKRMVFLGHLWVTLAIMFLTGTNRVSLFSIGYLIGSFIFLWQGTDFYLRPKAVILKWWSTLMRYSACVILVKVLLQVPGCIYSKQLEEDACWLVQLLGIGCVDKFQGGGLRSFLRMTNYQTGKCSVPQEDIGLAWDGVCFAFLLIQKRIFLSYYFYRVIDESKATTILSSRGAELIEELRQKQMKHQEEQEMKILEKIKVKMERIKANQKRLHGAVTKEPVLHDKDDDEDTEAVESERAPLVRGDSETSGRGYHTPQSPTSPKGFHTPVSSDGSEQNTPQATPKRTPTRPPPLSMPSQSVPGPPSPSSALMTTASLDAYLEPQRISYGSPPASELNPREEEESYPVFSPLPRRRRSTAQRASIISYSERSAISHHTYEADPAEGTVRRRREFRHRAEAPEWAAWTSAPYRPYDPPSHQKAIRSGDYYMFDEFDVKGLDPVEKDSSSDEDAPSKDLGIGKLLSTAIKSDMRQAVQERRASMPAVSRRASAARAHSLFSDHTFPRRTRSRLQSSQRQSEGAYSAAGASARRTPERLADSARRRLQENDQEDDTLLGITPPEGQTVIDKMKHYWEVVAMFVDSVLVSLTRWLLNYSRDYRYVSRALATEKKVLKAKEGFGIGIRDGSQMIWEPLPTVLPRAEAKEEAVNENLLMVPVDFSRKLSDISVPEIRILAPSMERGLDTTHLRRTPSPSRSPSPSESETDTQIKSDDTSEHESAFELETMSSKEVSVLEEQDDSMFRHNTPTLLHLLYALWYTILAHTDIVCYLMVFINQIQSATILSIPLPLMVFLWGTLTIPRPTKTFWVTLIAYTEVIVLVKSMFQFDILPWNQDTKPANTPFTAPRIIGIERKSNYALYDLLLLLVIFLHRFMLKGLGLWKESAGEVELKEDQQFRLLEEDVQMIAEGRGEDVGLKYAHIHERTGICHRLINPMYYLETTLHQAMEELSAGQSDPYVKDLVRSRVQPSNKEQPTFKQRFRIAVSERLRKMNDEMNSESRVPSEQHQDGEERSRENDESQKSGGDRRAENEGNSHIEAGPSTHSDHYNVNDDQEPMINVTSEVQEIHHHWPEIITLSVQRYLQPLVSFFRRMLEPTARVTADVYAHMFLCDFFNFLVVIFGFAAFGTQQGDGGVQAYLEENKVPIPFLVMLILQFALIIIDRALYLRKFILGKILFQFGLIIGVHIWMFFVLPAITERTFNAKIPPPLWYMVKCIYLLLSAYQIRCGYPRRIIGNFLCKSYGLFNMTLFRGFMMVPFVFELRTLMDWMWTDTSMNLMDWLKMEDIFANVFLLKCGRNSEEEFPQERAVKKTSLSKYMLGGTVLVFIIAIIWFPLVLFAFGSTVGSSNPPTDVTLKIRIGPFLPVYLMSARSNDIKLFTPGDYDTLSNLYMKDRTAQTFLSNYMYDDVAVVSMSLSSGETWDIPNPEKERLLRLAESNQTITVTLTFVVSHVTNSPENPPTIEETRDIELPPALFADNATLIEEQRRLLIRMLNDTANSTQWMWLPKLFPKFIKVFNKGTAKATDQLMISSAGPYSEYRGVLLQLQRDSRGNMFWSAKEACDEHDQKQTNNVLKLIPHNSCDQLTMFTFNDKIFPETLNFISGSGIIGLYTTFVFLASRVLRGFFSGIYTRIMFDDLPNVDRVLQLCLDIYLVREAVELSLEEDLFAKLVFLYRSPETMIKWSRPKEEANQPLPPPNV